MSVIVARADSGPAGGAPAAAASGGSSQSDDVQIFSKGADDVIMARAVADGLHALHNLPCDYAGSMSPELPSKRRIFMSTMIACGGGT